MTEDQAPRPGVSSVGPAPADRAPTGGGRRRRVRVHRRTAPGQPLTRRRRQAAASPARGPAQRAPRAPTASSTGSLTAATPTAQAAGRSVGALRGAPRSGAAHARHPTTRVASAAKRGDRGRRTRGTGRRGHVAVRKAAARVPPAPTSTFGRSSADRDAHRAGAAVTRCAQGSPAPDCSPEAQDRPLGPRPHRG